MKKSKIIPLIAFPKLIGYKVKTSQTTLNILKINFLNIFILEPVVQIRAWGKGIGARRWETGTTLAVNMESLEAKKMGK